MRVKLSKHHGLGNDFLVLFDDQPLPRLAWEHLARRWCHRHRGVGADGLILGLTRPAIGEVGMALYNADGTRAEMSGNGIRCLAHAWAMRNRVSEGHVDIGTDAGLRRVTYGPGPDTATLQASVAMGRATTIPAPAAWAATGIDPHRPCVHVSLGNPHSVVAVDDVDAVDLAALGAQLPDVNLEVVGPLAEHAVRLRVHERGAGITQACGTGAVAAAWAAHAWGLVTVDANQEITVRMDGGDAKVRVADELVLTGPSTHVADIEAH